jgi:glutamate dehydrogenase
MHPDVNEDQVKALSMWNGIKSSILSLPFGGAKGGVVCDPRTMSFRELEHLTRGYIRAISSVIGPAKDIPAMDPFSSPQLMSWMADEYRNTHPGESASFITGKPIVLGGLRGRDTAIADGMVSFIRETAHIRRLDLKSSGMIVQGFGSAGSLIAKSLYDSGVRIVGISDAYGALYNPDGLQMDELLNSRDSFGTVTKLFEHTITNKELLEKPCDILVLAAIENQITESNAKKIRARAVIEGTGGAISDKGAQMLEEENILVIPEIIAGAGDVAFSYLEWARHLQGNIWTDQEVGKKLSQILTGALHDVSETAKERKVIMKKAALLVGIERLAEAVRYRGWV